MIKGLCLCEIWRFKVLLCGNLKILNTNMRCKIH